MNKWNDKLIYIYIYLPPSLSPLLSLKIYFLKEFWPEIIHSLIGLEFFPYLKNVALVSSCLHCLRWEICSHPYRCFSLCHVPFSILTTFKIFSLSLVLSYFIMMCLAVVLFIFIVLEICWASCVYGFTVFIKFENVSTIIFSNMYPALCFPSGIPATLHIGCLQSSHTCSAHSPGLLLTGFHFGSFLLLCSQVH